MAGRESERKTRARADVDKDPESVSIGGRCDAPLVERVGKQFTGEHCGRPAGQGTDHVGVGRCSVHSGNSVYERARGAWAMGHAIARLRNTTPWEALLDEVKRSAGAVYWLDQKVAQATDDDDLAPGGSHHHWVRERQIERAHLAKVSKIAIDAGIQERLVQTAELEVRLVGQAINRVLEGLGLPDEVMMRARGMIRTELLALEAPQAESESDR